jgi:hypothetical protein
MQKNKLGMASIQKVVKISRKGSSALKWKEQHRPGSELGIVGWEDSGGGGT